MTPHDASLPTRRSGRRARHPAVTVPAGDVLEKARDEASADSDEPGLATASPESPTPTDAVTPAPAEVDAAPADVDAAPRDVDTAHPQHVPPTTTTTPAPAHLALGWVDERDVLLAPPPVQTLEDAASPYLPVDADLLSGLPRRSPFRPGVLVPLAIIAFLIGLYSATTLLWPLHAIPATVDGIQVQPVAAPAAAFTWPAEGSASMSVAGMNGVVSSSADPAQIASITKVVTALMVLEEMPLAPGEQGPEFRFTDSDSLEYWSYLENNESALDVPAGGTLTQYQLLEGMLIGSANNYADRLAATLWPTDAVFEDAADNWLSAHGVPGVTVVEPTGLDSRNAASPEALIALAVRAMAHPVIAEIVGKPAVELPGAGLVTNTNALLADPGVIGIKTGSLDSYNLLSAKNIVVGETTVRVYSAVLGQPDEDTRLAVSRTLYAEIESALQRVPSVPVGTVVGQVTTVWGEDVDIVTDADASVILWNGGVGDVTTEFSLGDAREEGADVGTLSVQGPLDTASTTLSLTAEIEQPTAWWRLTHPLDLFGLN